jgi:hypothetical protein
VNNLELRANLPAVLRPDLVPGVLVFLDAGYYNQVGEPGVSSPGSGFVAGTGAGAYIDALNLDSLAVYLEYRLDKPNAAGNRVQLFAEFGMHF